MVFRKRVKKQRKRRGDKKKRDDKDSDSDSDDDRKPMIEIQQEKNGNSKIFLRMQAEKLIGAGLSAASMAALSLY